MNALLAHLRLRPQLFSSLLTGSLAAALCPSDSLVMRLLVGWNVCTWLYLALIGRMMWKADLPKVRRIGISYAEGAPVVVSAAVTAAVASLAAIVLELSTAKSLGGDAALPHVLIAASTLVCSWLLLPVLFALSYASVFYRESTDHHSGRGLDFPNDGPENDAPDTPDYVEFMYFSITIAATSQTSDVAVTTREMRRWVIAHAALSFAFNTSLLALGINLAAGLIN